ncbi:MAG: glutaredoxin family protein [Promethearchaeota archaeon]
MIIISGKELIEKLAKEIDGEKGAENNIILFTLSTCMWCKKCKRFLSEHNLKYKYIDLDKIGLKEKTIILDYLKSNYQSRIAYPFLICEKGNVVGYDPNKYMEILKGVEP